MKNALLSAFIFVTALALGQKALSQDDPDKVAYITKGIKEITEMINSGDLSGADKYIDANYVEHSPSPGLKAGIEGFIESIMSLRKGFPDLRITINNLIVSETKACWLSTMTGTNTGEFMGMKPTGNKINVMGLDWINLKNEKCTEHWGYIDDGQLMQQLGLNK